MKEETNRTSQDDILFGTNLSDEKDKMATQEEPIIRATHRGHKSKRGPKRIY